ncbi:hypothetical protein MTO96_043680 [Rhipicephalus appendiculatus]
MQLSSTIERLSGVLLENLSKLKQHAEGRLLYLHSKPDVERTSAGIRRDMTLASRLKTPVNGLKGASPLVKLPHFDLVWGYTVEYMHSVLLGVTRQFADYWFDSSNSNEAYYMGWLLMSFVSQAAGLYRQRCMSFNVHQLLHLAEAARQFGPLWAHSAFAFESSNGDLVKLVNAAKAVPAQNSLPVVFACAANHKSVYIRDPQHSKRVEEE